MFCSWLLKLRSKSDHLKKAREYINKVRARAAASPILNGGVNAANYLVGQYAAFANQAAARTAVRFERFLELGMEGHRFFDLVRWGVAATEISAYLTKEIPRRTAPLTGAVFNANKDEYMPIPDYAISQSIKDGTALIKQNPGY